ncbi:MAG: ABC transporter ATP-binding protein [Alphaproteobacteria bacterium CG11_big_fil_rev_8_21_14_0_20_44_7]|nr:MAG: ABC transporter ATP-binding protein [Alphaproteobacteria bacterium CG11_big_fil_rev_8_21_14_0_20_44_7]
MIRSKKTEKETKIELCNLKKSFGSKLVLDGVDIDVKKGESLVVIGGSGSGKSVLIKSIIGIIQPDSGIVKIDGKDINHLTGKEYHEYQSHIGMLFQGGALFDSLKVWENISFRLLNRERVSKKEAKEIAVAKLAQVGLSSEVADLQPSELSGGMQKRVALARAIATNPEIIFFDEPTTGLDPIMADVINDLIVKCSKELNATTVTITHDMASARKISDRIAMLYKGKIIWHGNTKDIDKSKNDYVNQFIHGHAEGPIKMELKR